MALYHIHGSPDGRFQVVRLSASGKMSTPISFADELELREYFEPITTPEHVEAALSALRRKGEATLEAAD